MNPNFPINPREAMRCTCVEDWGKREPTCSDYERCGRSRNAKLRIVLYQFMDVAAMRSQEPQYSNKWFIDKKEAEDYLKRWGDGWVTKHVYQLPKNAKELIRLLNNSRIMV
jgi:hypothetical protein